MSTGLMTTAVGHTAFLAHAAGSAQLVISQVGFGDASGVPYLPNPNQVSLVNERYRATIASLAVVAGALVIDCVLPADTPDGQNRPSNGFNIHEAGVFGTSGGAPVMMGLAQMDGGYKTPPSAGQTQIASYRFILACRNPHSIAVVIDPQAQVILGRNVRAFWMAVDGVLNDPPANPAVGATYIIGTAPTGAWAGFANKLVQWVGVWSIATAPTGHMVCDNSRTVDHVSRFLKFDAAAGWSNGTATEAASGFIRAATLAETQLQMRDDLAISPRNSRFIPIYLDQIRAATWFGVMSITQTSQPGTPAPEIGDTYVIPATGAVAPWAAHPNKVAVWTGSDWFYFVPREGVMVRALDNGAWRRRSGGLWVDGYAGITNATAGVVALADGLTAANPANGVNPLTPQTLPIAMAGGYTEAVLVTASSPYVPPLSNPRFIGCDVELVAGGASGGVSNSGTADIIPGGGGGNGQVMVDSFNRSELAASIAITIGAGGAPRTASSGPGDGTDGGDTSFGALLVAKGGKKGQGLGGLHGAGGLGGGYSPAGVYRNGKTKVILGSQGENGFLRAGGTVPTPLWGDIGRGGQSGYKTTGGPNADSAGGGNGAARIINKFI